MLSWQSSKLTDLEDRSRRANLIIHGVLENTNENDTSLRTAVATDIFEKTLGVKCKSIARIHRLGRQGSRRPVIAYFQDYQEKQEVLKNSNKLKGSNIYVQNDYSQCTLRKRRLLWESAKAERDSRKRVTLIHDKIKIDGKLFGWDEAKNARVALHPQATGSD